MGHAPLRQAPRLAECERRFAPGRQGEQSFGGFRHPCAPAALSLAARRSGRKRLDYAEARISEYWIVNSLDETVTVLVLAGSAYREHGVFAKGQQVASVCLPDYSLDVASLSTRTDAAPRHQ